MDQNKFINTYVDTIISNLLEHVKTNLQLQTQLKISEFVIAEKDQVISSLTKRLSEENVVEDWKTKYETTEVNYMAALGKLKHMNTLLTQVNEMKNMIASKDAKIDQLNKEIMELQGSKKVINIKTPKKQEKEVPIVSKTKQEKTLDDF